MSESLVDLLLVRLGREEEKRKVLKLLITSLDLSVSDAEDAVNNSPSVIREAVPMAEARIIQKDLYPYIDLLPRFDDDDGQADSDSVDESPEEVDDFDEEAIEDIDEVIEEGADEEIEEETDEEGEEPQEIGEPEPEEPILITSASDEVRSTRRCHICGRTPTDGEKLAPCRTCSDLTCRDCFDRLAHVCSKCAAAGKSIEHANEGVEPEKEQGLVFDTDETRETSKGKAGSGVFRYGAVALLFILALAAVFYFMDPMGLFGEEASPEPSGDIAGTDTTEIIRPDTSANLQEDTLAAVPDTLQVIDPPAQDEDPYGLASLVLDDEYSAIENPAPVDFRRSAPASVRASVLREESDIIADQVAVIAAWIPVQLDDAVLLQYHDSTEVLVLVLKHPEETESRLDLLRRISSWLTPSEIDQLVLLYRENRYQNTVIMSLVSSNFPLVQGVLSPAQFQNYLSYREDCWESISGPVSAWLTDTQ